MTVACTYEFMIINILMISYGVFTDQNSESWKSSHWTKGTIMDPNYSLPPNVALITLEVEQMLRISVTVTLLTISLSSNQISFAGVGWWSCASPFGTSL